MKQNLLRILSKYPLKRILSADIPAKTLIWLAAFVLQAQIGFAQIDIALWNFTGAPGNQATTTGTGVTNVTATDFTRGAGINATAGANSINSNGWDAGDDRYLSFGFTVAGGFRVNLSTLKIGTSASGTGPRDMALVYSGDNFATPLHTWIQPNTFLNQVIDLSALTNLTGTVEFRIISTSNVSANNGTVGSGGTFRVTNYFDGGTNTGSSAFTGIVEAGTGPAISLSTDPATLAFGTVNINATTTDLTYALSAQNITEDVTVSASAPFSLSKNGTDFSNELTFTAAELGTAQTISVRLDNSTAGTFSTNISHSTAGANASLPITATVFDPLNITENFNNSCPAGLPAGWSAVSITGAQIWACTTFGRAGTTPTASAPHGVQMNGFASGAAQLNEDWIITPAYTLTDFNIPILSFWSRVAFTGPRLRLLISTNYVSGDPLAAGVIWTELSDRFAISDVWTFSEGIDLSAYKTAGVRIAFVYNSSLEEGAARWTLDDFSLVSSDTPPAPFLVTSIGTTDYTHFGNVPVGTASAKTYTFNFTLNNATQALTVAAVNGFEFSKNGTDFSASLSYTAEEARNSNQVTVRFRPNAEGAFGGAIRLESGSIVRTQGYLSGATLANEATFDVVTWNIEWFGDAGNGPSDLDLQLENVKKVIEDLDADVYAFQEITNLDRFYELVEALPGYEGFHSTAVSDAGTFETAQKVTFLYKTATVDTIRTQILLKGTTPASLTDYPAPADRFWASGRLPFMVEINAKIGEEERNISLINIHARANGAESEANPRYAMRKYDVGVLKDSLDTYFGDKAFILLGDYNDDLDQTVADPAAPTIGTTESSYVRYINDTQNYVPTTLSLSNAGLRSFITFDNVIDHVIISNELEEDWLVRSERIAVPFDIVSNYQNTTSDHLPVKVSFRFKPEGAVTSLNPLLNKSEITAYPNPIADVLRVRLQSQAAEQAKVAVYNAQGALVYSQDASLTVGENILELSTSQWALKSGIYFLKVSMPSQGIYQSKILKQ